MLRLFWPPSTMSNANATVGDISADCGFLSSVFVCLADDGTVWARRSATCYMLPGDQTDVFLRRTRDLIEVLVPEETVLSVMSARDVDRTFWVEIDAIAFDER